MPAFLRRDSRDLVPPALCLVRVLFAQCAAEPAVCVSKKVQRMHAVAHVCVGSPRSSYACPLVLHVEGLGLLLLLILLLRQDLPPACGWRSAGTRQSLFCALTMPPDHAHVKLDRSVQACVKKKKNKTTE